MIRLRDITKVYHLGEIDLQVLKGITLDINGGEFVSLTGASGSGKSTLMNILGCLDRPTSGHYYIAGEDVAKFNAAERATLRNKRIGFVFQNFNLLSRTTALENVMMPAVYAHPALSMKAMRERSVELLNLVGLSDRMDHTPAQLSGGQQQRTALARILVGRPKILMLDEPFSALDSYLREEVEGEVGSLLAGFGGTALLVTHNRDEAYRLCRDMIVMDGGQVLRTGGTKEVFADPQSTTAARLTGCKNILSCTRVDAHTVRLTGWDAPLHLAAEVPETCTAVGIRAHDFAPCAPAAPNALPVQLNSTSENPFDWNLIFTAPDGTTRLWWKVSKTNLTAASPEAPAFLGTAPQNIMPLG